MSRRFRSFLLCLAAAAILPLAVPGVASSAPKAAPTSQATGDATSGIPTHFSGGCENGHRLQPSDPLSDLLQRT